MLSQGQRPRFTLLCNGFPFDSLRGHRPQKKHFELGPSKECLWLARGTNATGWGDNMYQISCKRIMLKTYPGNDFVNSEFSLQLLYQGCIVCTQLHLDVLLEISSVVSRQSKKGCLAECLLPSFDHCLRSVPWPSTEEKRKWQNQYNFKKDLTKPPVRASKVVKICCWMHSSRIVRIWCRTNLNQSNSGTCRTKNLFLCRTNKYLLSYDSKSDTTTPQGKTVPIHDKVYHMFRLHKAAFP